MWQRVQTIFLILIIISLLVTLIQPIWIIGEGDSKQVLTPFYFLSNNTYQYLPYSTIAMLAVASITVTFLEIRKFKNRLSQMKLGVLNSLLLVGIIGASVYFGGQLAERFQGGHYGLGLYLPAFAVICNLLANQFIRRDERLVRDSERLR